MPPAVLWLLPEGRHADVAAVAVAIALVRSIVARYCCTKMLSASLRCADADRRHIGNKSHVAHAAGCGARRASTVGAWLIDATLPFAYLLAVAVSLEIQSRYAGRPSITGRAMISGTLYE